jgi:hypothetical protein
VIDFFCQEDFGLCGLGEAGSFGLGFVLGLWFAGVFGILLRGSRGFGLAFRGKAETPGVFGNTQCLVHSQGLQTPIRAEKSDFFEKIGFLGRSHLDSQTFIRSLPLLPYSLTPLFPHSPIPLLPTPTIPSLRADRYLSKALITERLNPNLRPGSRFAEGRDRCPNRR